MNNRISSRLKPRSLKIGFFNADGLLKQKEEIGAFLRDHQLDVLLIQETFLKPHHRDPRIANYQLVRNDRTHAPKGGTVIYYKRSLHCVPIDTPNLAHIEASVCRIGMTGHSSITLVSAYISCQAPSATPIQTDIQTLLALSDSVLIAGDLNAKHVAWCSHSCNPRGNALYHLSSVHHFDIIAPMTPTRFPYTLGDQRPDVLDIALLKNVNLRIRSIEALDELQSDHRPVILDLISRVGPSDPGQPPPTKMVTDWRKLKDLLQATSSAHLDAIPDTLETVEDTNGAVESLTKHVQSAVNECSRQVPAIDDRWKLPDEVRALMTEKNAAIRALRTYPTDANRAFARSLQRKVSDRVKELRDDRWGKFVGSLKPTHHAFWDLQRKLKSKQESPMPPLKRPDRSIAFDDDEKSECLADSLEAQCSPSTLPSDKDHLDKVNALVDRKAAEPPSEDPDNPLPPVSADEVLSIVKNLKPRKAPGSDGITNKVIKLFPGSLIILMTAIFNASLSLNLFPHAWKEATVIGIHKPGKPASEPTSYRPISLLNILGKIYERIVYMRLKDFAESRSLLPNEQFGFRAKHSCVHQVHRIVEHISAGFQKSLYTGMLFFDVAKAFDKVWHNGLLYKLYQLGVPDRLVLIIRDFLSDRSFRYRIEGVLSSPRPIRAGVPQGSVLSPLLFTLFTSDIPVNKSKTKLALFADDTAIYYTGRSGDVISRSLQSAANALGAWFRKWRIEVNPEKSAAVLFCRLWKDQPVLRPISMFGKAIPWESQAKYLGVILDNHLTFSKHLKAVRARAAFALGRLHHLLNAKSKLSLRNKVRLYVTCIRPIMTYASVVFAHSSDNRLHRLQTLQNRFMRMATGAPHYMRNVQLHVDLKLPTIRQYLKRLSKRYFESAARHPNPLLVSAVSYVPSRISKIRRPRHALTYPDDAITICQEKTAARAKALNTVQNRRPLFRPRRRGPSRSPSNLSPPRPLLIVPPAGAEPDTVALNMPLNNQNQIQLVPSSSLSPSNALSRGPSPIRGRP